MIISQYIIYLFIYLLLIIIIIYQKSDRKLDSGK